MSSSRASSASRRSGLVEEAPGGEFQKGEVVATAMGGMGRLFDGGYAEYTCVPATQVQAIKTELALGNLRRDPGNAANSMGFAIQVASSGKRRASADSRRHDFRRAGRCGDRQKLRGVGRINDAQPRPRSTAARRAVPSRCLLTTGRLPSRSGRHIHRASTKCLNSSAPQRFWIRCVARNRAVSSA